MSVMNPAPMIVPWFAIVSWLFYVVILLAIIIGFVVFMVKTVKYLKGIPASMQARSRMGRSRRQFLRIFIFSQQTFTVGPLLGKKNCTFAGFVANPALLLDNSCTIASFGAKPVLDGPTGCRYKHGRSPL